MGLEPKILCTKNWPKSMFPFANFIFSHYEIWVHLREGVQGGGEGTPLLVWLLAVLINPCPCPAV